MSQDTETPDPILQGLIYPNGVLNHALYYRLLRQATKLPPPPGSTSPCPQAAALLATLDATALRYLLSDLSYTDPHAMDLLVNPESGDIKHGLYWSYTFKVHQRADQRAWERLAHWARAHSQGFADADSEVRAGDGQQPCLITSVDVRGSVQPGAEVQCTLPATREEQRRSQGRGRVWARNRRRNVSTRNLWHGAVLPFTNIAVAPSQMAVGEGQGRREGDVMGLEAPPPPYAP